MTSTAKHRKHTKLSRPAMGSFGRNEIALIGAPCGVIQELAGEIGSFLGKRWKCVFVDADHGSGDASSSRNYALFTDKITARRLDTGRDYNTFERRVLLAENDCVLINGNHFEGDAQIVLLHPAKEDSLSRKLDRLTNVQLVIRAQPDLAPYPFLEPHIPEGTPVIDIADINAICAWFEVRMEAATPPLKGLILAGGKSQRMGHDKTEINYRGIPQMEYLKDLLQPHCETIYVSRRQDQNGTAGDNVLEDTFKGLGPYGGILSAFRLDPDSAWLVIAVDLPLVDEQTLTALLSKRNPARIATAFHNPATDFPEPLITIWEPKAYPVLLNFLAQGYSCPRKVLINSDVELISPANPAWLKNVNTPEDLKEVRKMFKV